MRNLHDFESGHQSAFRKPAGVRCPACGGVKCSLFDGDAEKVLNSDKLKQAAAWRPDANARGILALVGDRMWLLESAVHIRALDLTRLHRLRDKVERGEVASAADHIAIRRHIDYADARLVEAVLLREQGRANRARPR